MAGPAGIGKRIDALSVALFTGLAVADLKQLDLAYVPPRSTVWDPILIAGHELEKKLTLKFPDRFRFGLAQTGKRLEMRKSAMQMTILVKTEG